MANSPSPAYGSVDGVESDQGLLSLLTKVCDDWYSLLHESVGLSSATYVDAL